MKKNLSLVLGSLLFFIILIEIPLRIVYSKRNLEVSLFEEGIYWESNIEWDRPVFRQDDLLFWKNKTNLNPQEAKNGNKNLGAYGKGYRINKHGFRGPDISSKPAGGFRIVTMGDSCTFGWYYRPYAEYLNEKLHKNTFFTSKYSYLDVINAGVSGYSSFQGLLSLKHEILSLKPDVITIWYGLNDYIYNHMSDRNLFIKTQKFRSLKKIFHHSHLYLFLKQQILSYKWHFRKNITQTDPVRRSTVEEFKDNLRQMARLAREQGIKVIFLNSPTKPGKPLTVNRRLMTVREGGKTQKKWQYPVMVGKKPIDNSWSLDIVLDYLEKYPEHAYLHYLASEKYRNKGQHAEALHEEEIWHKLDKGLQEVRTYNRAIRDVAAEQGLPFIDLHDIFRKTFPANIFFDERHFNHVGHKKIAEILLARIIRE